MNYSRRDVIKLFGASLIASVPVEDAFASPEYFAPPGQPVRMPLDEFTKSPKLVALLRKGIKEMKKRKPSDPLSFFFQAAIHGITDEAIENAKKEDPEVVKVIKYWNQCPHGGENSANFLPWHRGYTYHFEKILRMHTGDSSFALPYWNYMDKKNRKFPKEFGIEHLDGNLENNTEDNINPLYNPKRDFYFTSYEHPFSKGLPLLQLSDKAVDISFPMSCPVFFGETEREGLGGGIADDKPSTRGLLESYPHDQIHRAVGGIIPNGCACACTPKPGEEPDFDAVGAMAQPPTAGFDPIFSIHHCTIDWIWVMWASIAGKKWGKLPPNSWFNEKPWFFFDVDGSVVNEPRKYYFDHRKLGIRFKYENIHSKPLTLPVMDSNVTEHFIFTKKEIEKLDINQSSFRVPPNQKSVIKISLSSINKIRSSSITMKENQVNNFKSERVFLQLKNVDTQNTEATGFDVYLTSNLEKPLLRGDDSFIGCISLFNHIHHTPSTGMGHDMHNMNEKSSEGVVNSFDISRALATVENIDNLSLVIIPFSLFDHVDNKAPVFNRFSLRIKGVEFLAEK